MYLKSITLKGFKSFPERTRLEFGPGVSVVVGPNGSGKSNITDAVLWALGEQSPVAVRGHSMQDVIFAGAPGRQGASAAEVELVLEDSEGSLGIGVPEVSIVRSLERAGEGEYRLAGARCRLVDVIEVLSDTGLGKEMHSVISQGRVESIVTSKPRDRRLLIEEAAGLGKHRKRRRRAQLKLMRTQDNLDRALDVEREARSRLRPLKRQAEAAELHARLERQALEARWELTRDELRANLAAVKDAEERATGARARREKVEQELGAVASQRERAEEALARRSAQREELSRRCFIAQSAEERVCERTESVRSGYAEVEARLRRASTLLSEAVDEPTPEVPDAGARRRIASLEAALEALMRDREAELERQLGDLELQVGAAQTELEERSHAVARGQEEREDAEQAAERGRMELREAEHTLERARRDAAAVGGELAAVNQFLRSQAGSPGAAAALADELEVEPGCELAVTAALDGRLRAALVSDRRSAGELLDAAGSDGGRALIADDPSPGSPAAGSYSPGAAATRSGAGSDPAAPVPGARPLHEFVRGPSRSLTLAKTLLRDTWLVDSLDQVPGVFNGVAVTPEGRVWSPNARELRQAPLAGQERVLAQRNRREQLIQSSETAASAELAAAAALERAQEFSSQLDGVRERSVSQHRAAVRARDEAGEEVGRLRAVIERRRSEPDEGRAAGRRIQLEAELSAERAQLQQAEREAATRRERITRLRQARDHDASLLPALARVIEALKALVAAIRERRGAFDAALAGDRQAGEQVAAELRSCAQQEAALHGRLHQQNEALTENEVRLQRARDQAADSEQQLTEIAAKLQLDVAPGTEALGQEQRQTLLTRLERLARRRELLGPVNPLAQQEYGEAREHVEELEHQREDLETALRELERLITDTDRQIRETFEQTFAAAARNFEVVSEQLFPGGRGRLRLVSEREGPARVLGGAVSPVRAEGSAEESEELEAGTDELEASSQEDALGVEIEIRPAGKEMRGLSLLSGGEKSLTALAFLFAVFLARPCPFYILDEVEAALDDPNIDRFLQLLRGYSNQAQFIVVTHQRRTMEAADSLYGVSMGADGISKVISRRLPAQEQAAA